MRPDERGTRTALACSPYPGGSFSAPTERGTRTALACSPLTGGEFFAEPQRGIRRAPRRGKRVDTKVSTLLTPTSFCLLVWRRSETGDRFEKGEQQRIFITAGEHSVLPFLYLCAVPDSVLLHIPATLRRRDISVSRSSLAWWPRSAPAGSIIGAIYPAGVPLAAPHNALPLRNSPFSIFNSPFAESPPQTVLEHLLYLKENHSTETILHADSPTASHKLNTAAAAPDIVHSSADTAA